MSSVSWEKVDHLDAPRWIWNCFGMLPSSGVTGRTLTNVDVDQLPDIVRGKKKDIFFRSVEEDEMESR